MKGLSYIERYESKITTFNYFAVDFDDRNIIICNKKFPFGYMSNCIANLPKEDATKLLIHSGKINRHWQQIFSYDYGTQAAILQYGK